MNFKITLLATLLAASMGAIAHNQAEFAPVIDECQVAIMMNRVYELMIPEYKKVYKRHYDEIEWLEHFYVCNPEQGDAVIMVLAQELQDVLMNQMDRFVDVIIQEMGVGSPSAQERQALSSVMSQLMPVMMVQGLQKNAELKSSIYQELYGK